LAKGWETTRQGAVSAQNFIDPAANTDHSD